MSTFVESKNVNMISKNSLSSMKSKCIFTEKNLGHNKILGKAAENLHDIVHFRAIIVLF